MCVFTLAKIIPFAEYFAKTVAKLVAKKDGRAGKRAAGWASKNVVCQMPSRIRFRIICRIIVLACRFALNNFRPSFCPSFCPNFRPTFVGASKFSKLCHPINLPICCVSLIFCTQSCKVSNKNSKLRSAKTYGFVMFQDPEHLRFVWLWVPRACGISNSRLAEFVRVSSRQENRKGIWHP